MSKIPRDLERERQLVGLLREVEAAIPLMFDGSHLLDCPYVHSSLKLVALKKRIREALS